MRAVSLFSGAGGLDLGLEAAGFRTAAAVEIDPVARQTLQDNALQWFPQLKPAQVCPDIVGTDPEDILDGCGIDVGELDLVHGGPPCTPFPKSGYWLAYKRAGEDPKASLLDNFVDFVRVAKPRAFLMENVYGLAYANHNRPVLNRFRRRISSAGYSFDRNVILAADHGVPQLRQRLFCVGVRKDLLDVPPASWRFGWPDQTHAGPHETRRDWREDLPPHVTAEEALRGLNEISNPAEPEEVIKGTYASELAEIPPGENYLYFTAKRGHAKPRFEWRSRYWSFLLKLDPARPSPTIQGQPGPWVGPFHWENRRLRVAELKRLMTIPDDYVIRGSRREQQLQLGNAVPPVLAKALGDALRDELTVRTSVALADAA